MIPALNIIAPLAKILFNTVDKAVLDKDQAEKLKAQLNTQLLQSSTEELKAAASIVEAEAKSNWFVAGWRPTLMYVLIFILVWNYIAGPIVKIFTGTIITFELPGDVWTLLNIGLGGYVVGRSGESIARTLINKK
jgi:glutathione S-transferase